MSSGSYFPSPPVKAVMPILEAVGGVRVLGVLTVTDRIAQTAVKMRLEPRLEPLFPRRFLWLSAGQIGAGGDQLSPRRRCWDQDWVVEFDIRGLLDAASYCPQAY